MAPADGAPQAQARGRLLPTLLSLFIGALIGALLLLLLRPAALVDATGEPAPVPTITATVTATPSPPPGTTRLSVDVPDSCLEALRQTGSSAVKVRDLVDALQSLRVGRARELAGELAAENPGQLLGVGEECRELLEAARGSSTPTPQPS